LQTFTGSQSISTTGPPTTGIPLIAEPFHPAFISSIVPSPDPPAPAEKSLIECTICSWSLTNLASLSVLTSHSSIQEVLNVLSSMFNVSAKAIFAVIY
jgi:hypothetical protein